ncbi:Ubiquitin carboxyl-terminal hydrolase 16 [Camellia lanceoleosa]|uniref:Ubiquitin carboxyl-terminal hydrolase 16 n=1 Tax=Camellia lanceoleosa TaxID=1840588 RepID=A0ACC0GW96_9ERIC|nr:Ubiquitin carboxyl-terminal hydrolase 16 [Camellia lanceoleosa]
MLLGGGLGFSYLVLVVLLVLPLIVFFLRRKWRISVARTDEIKRLLVLASEEEARAEFEVSIAYYDTPPTVSISRPLQYQCAVCFFPTKRLCSRCKAVRYCSGKCQIIHWRQGHKEECRPFTSSYQNNDTLDGSYQKVLKQDEYEIHGNGFETEGRRHAKSVQNFAEEPPFLNSDCSPEVFCGNDDSEVECLVDGKGTNSSSHETERSDGHQSINVFPEKCVTNRVNNVDQNGQRSYKHTILVDSVDCLTNSGKLNQIKPDCTNHDTQCESTSSSGWSANGSNESFFSEPSTPSSGFWQGTINSSRPKIDAFDDSAQSSSSGAGEAYVLDSRSSPSLSFNIDKNADPPVDVQGSGTKTDISDDAHSTTFGIKKPIHGAFLSEVSGDASKGRSSQLLSPEKSEHLDVYASSGSPVLKPREHRSCSSGAYAYPTSSAGGPSISTRASKVSNMQSLSPERSNHAVDDTRNTLHALESKKSGSLSSSASVARLSSSTRRHCLHDANPGKVDSAHPVAATSEYASYSPNARNGLKTSMRKVVDQLRPSKSSQNYQSGVGNEIAGRYDNKGLFPYKLFVKLYNWNKIELQPCGLTNCGNSCYANAVLQCLACTPPLTAYLLQGFHSKACDKRKWCFTCEFESLILKAKEGTSPVSPIRILSRIQNIGSHLGNGSEEDAHEFLRYAIDTMQSVCLKEAGLNESSSLEDETTLIGLTFGGYLRSKIKCIKCGGKSERHERMMDLTVEIGGDIGTLEEALRKFTGTEILDGENKYQCSRCRSYERAKKKLTVLEAPNVLTIALKRFQTGKFGKLNKSIQFPEILDLAPYMSGTSDKSPIYRLYGVVVHLDVMNAAFSGHYVCYVKNVQNKWFKIDDSTVKAVELDNVLTTRAYMLLYARCSPRAPRLIRNSVIPHDQRKPKNPIIKSRSRSTHPSDASGTDLLNGQTSFQPIRTILEEDSWSDNSSFFSEGCSCSSCSTESSNRDSTSADDYDHFFGDPGRNWSSPWKNSSDSDSSTSSSPSPLYSRHSPLADSDRYSSETGSFQIRNSELDMDNNGFWGRSGNWEGKSSFPILYSDSTKQCRKSESSGNSRETDLDRLGLANPFDNKKSGVFRRSMKERTD